MTFHEFNQQLQVHLTEMLSAGNLFTVDVDKDEMWGMYLDTYPAQHNRVYKTNREMDCSCCKQFVRDMGNVVIITDNYRVCTLWDFKTGTDQYDVMLEQMSAWIYEQAVDGAYVTRDQNHGLASTLQQLENDEVIRWNHFQVLLPKEHVNTTYREDNAIRAERKAAHDVFKRSLEELSGDAVQDVLDMIDENVLYRGEEWKSALNTFKTLQRKYNALMPNQRDNFVWRESVLQPVIAKIRNHSIGTLLVDLTEGMDADRAVKRWEAVMAPANYKRPKALFTKKMIQEAQETCERLGLSNSLGRRHARIDDITVQNVLWANVDAARSMDTGDPFALLEQDVAVDPKRLHATGMHIDEFMSGVLPSASSLELLVENKHVGNFVSLIAPIDADAPSLFKWDNPFSHSYTGNITDSDIKENVAHAGGNVKGVVRFSLQWNEKDDNHCDLDAHVVEPTGNEIYFSNKRVTHRSSGKLDVDIVSPNGVAVENIAYTNKMKMPDGIYKFYIHVYSYSRTTSGFRAQVEIEGQVYDFDYQGNLKGARKYEVAEVTLKDGTFTINEKLPSTTSQRNVWGVNTMKFTPVSTVMFSPNYWDGQGVGNKHWFFMLQGCVNDETPNGFYNEYLKNEFVPHKRVFEALGKQMRVEDSSDQLSGVGFSSTRRNSIIVRVDNSQLIKLVF